MGGKPRPAYQSPPELVRCKGQLHLANRCGILVRDANTGLFNGYCPECGMEVELKRARKTCLRMVPRYREEHYRSE